MRPRQSRRDPWPAALGVSIALLPASGAALATPPTFTQQAAPILFEHCVTCHRAGESGQALPLDTYDAARRSAAAIKVQVATRAMPPWSADPAHSLRFGNDARLSRRDIDVLVAWVDGGAVKGPDVPLPAIAAPAAAGWRHPDGTAPDAVYSLPEFSVGANEVVPYVQVLVKVPETTDRWIAAMQVLPGNTAIVHHIGIAEVTLSDGVTPKDLQGLDAFARQLGMPSGAALMSRPAVLDPHNPATYDMLGVYTPGSKFESFGEGNAKLLKGARTCTSISTCITPRRPGPRRTARSSPCGLRTGRRTMCCTGCPPPEER